MSWEQSLTRPPRFTCSCLVSTMRPSSSTSWTLLACLFSWFTPGSIIITPTLTGPLGSYWIGAPPVTWSVWSKLPLLLLLPVPVLLLKFQGSYPSTMTTAKSSARQGHLFAPSSALWLCHWSPTWCTAPQRMPIPPVSPWERGHGDLHQWLPGHRHHPSLLIASWGRLLLCGEKR